LLTGRHVSAIFSAIIRPNKEPEFRYIKCAPNGIPLGAHFIYLNSGSLLGLIMRN